MGLVKPNINSFAKIKVIGVGGGGGNAINSMVSGGNIQGVEFIAINTDLQALLSNNAPTKIQIGEKLTKGLGSGSKPDVGEQAALESKDKLKDLVGGADMIFIAACMGGGTGTGASPIIAEIAKESGALTVAVVTKPFVFEGTRRMVQADDGIDKLKEKVDTLIVIPNQRILDVADKNTSLVDAFTLANSILSQGVQGISDLITSPGLINVDFADVKTIMKDAGSALMGIGVAKGENRAITAARAAVNSPLLEINIEGARGILFNITGGNNLTIYEVNEAASVISEAADADAQIIFGTSVREDFGDEIKISVIATGFDDTRRSLPGYSPRNLRSPIDSINNTDDSNANTPPVPSEPDLKQKFNISHSEVEITDDLDIPAFLRKRS